MCIRDSCKVAVHGCNVSDMLSPFVELIRRVLVFSNEAEGECVVATCLVRLCPLHCRTGVALQYHDVKRRRKGKNTVFVCHTSPHSARRSLGPLLVCGHGSLWIVDSQVTASVVPKSGYQRGAIIVLIHVQPWSHTQLEDELVW